MPANTSPIFGLTPRQDQYQFATANTNRDGTTGTYQTGPRGVATGTRVKGIVLTATGTTTAGVIRIFSYDGTNRRLLAEILVQAITPSATIQVWTFTWTPPVDMDLPDTSHGFDFSTNNAETFNALFIGENY